MTYHVNDLKNVRMDHYLSGPAVSSLEPGQVYQVSDCGKFLAQIDDRYSGLESEIQSLREENARLRAASEKTALYHWLGADAEQVA